MNWNLLSVLLICLFVYFTILPSKNYGVLAKDEEDVDIWSSNKNQIGDIDSRKGSRKKLSDAEKQLKRQKKKLRKAKEGENMSVKKRRENKEIQAIRLWANSLTENDYNHTYWKEQFHTNAASDFFNAYARKISGIWKDIGAKVNFALVGACDGLGDKTIKTLYLPNEHWRGVFVEPVSINVRDLITFMAKKNAAHRSLIIRAAATSECQSDTIKMERPLYEEKNASIPVSLPNHRLFSSYFMSSSIGSGVRLVPYFLRIEIMQEKNGSSKRFDASMEEIYCMIGL